MGHDKKAELYPDLDDASRIAVCLGVLRELRAPEHILNDFFERCVHRYGEDVARSAAATVAVAMVGQEKALEMVEHVDRDNTDDELMAAARRKLKGE